MLLCICKPTDLVLIFPVFKANFSERLVTATSYLEGEMFTNILAIAEIYPYPLVALLNRFPKSESLIMSVKGSFLNGILLGSTFFAIIEITFAKCCKLSFMNRACLFACKLKPVCWFVSVPAKSTKIHCPILPLDLIWNEKMRWDLLELSFASV